MKIKPILFNTEMVRAIIEGRKTVTRRICKDCNDFVIPDMSFYDSARRTYAVHGYTDKEHKNQLFTAERPCPICPEDILYVRETWSWEACWDCGMNTEEHNCCDESAKKIFNQDKGEYGCYVYRESFGNNEYPSVGVWHSSIHMPREAARIWLKVKNVRVERLQTITGLGILAEGVCNQQSNPTMGKRWENLQRMEFEKLWDSTIKELDIEKYGWGADPWVWVIEFTRCDPLIQEFPKGLQK